MGEIGPRPGSIRRSPDGGQRDANQPGPASMGTEDDRDEWTSLVLLERFRGGDDLAAAEIFNRYFGRLTALARSRLSPRLARRTDPEDIVLSVYRSFFVAARRPVHPEPRGRPLEAARGHREAQTAEAGEEPDRGLSVG